MSEEIHFSLNHSRPLLPQLKRFIENSKVDTLCLTPENYLIVLHEMKARHNFPQAPKGTTLIIGNLLGCDVEMAMEDYG